ncbi:MAG: hypothetical protein DME44_03145 [Verrucomicrobia bacterium]|nr:MAG: hypothetical protein DME44_03145 [Verrucomicrobiota bacterium]
MRATREQWPGNLRDLAIVVLGSAARGQSWLSLFWRGGGNQFLEARIVAQWIKHWIQLEQRRVELQWAGRGGAASPTKIMMPSAPGLDRMSMSKSGFQLLMDQMLPA